jgi:purine-nucleoside phosphorylase
VPHTRAQVEEAVSAIRKTTDAAPEIAIILGTGLGRLGKRIENKTTIPYTEIPHFAQATTETHRGDLAFGTISGRPVVAMEGRFHLYEGYDLDTVTFPVRVMRALGAHTLLVSNAAGGLHPNHKKGDLLLIEDHISFFVGAPLAGPNDDELGPRYPDMIEPYDHKLIALAERICREEGFSAHQGTYVCVRGPQLETRAEYGMLQKLGADAVGMSTVPEVIIAVHSGFRVFGVSVITDLCDPDSLSPIDIEEIIRVASEAEPKMTKVLERLIEEIPTIGI